MRTVILDTSILVKLNGKKVGTAVQKILSEDLADAVLFISEISCYEFLRNVKDKNDMDERQKFLSQWPRLPVDTSLLKIGTYYYNILHRTKRSSGEAMFHKNQISDCDILIGATGIQVNALICTTNGDDFPRKMFNQVLAQTLPNSTEKVYLLSPDVEVFMRETEKFIDKK